MGKRGRPEHEPTAETRLRVQLMAVLGRPHHDIAKLIGTGTRQLLKHYRQELDFGNDLACVNVAGALYKNALKGNVVAQIFFLKNKAGWRDMGRIEHTAPGGGPIKHQHTQTAAQVTEEDALKSYLDMVTLPGSPVGHA